tara:strand:+ start:19690 stop:20181 length:492 start_codon:yes stop_codon:yes gene_type:complete
VSFYGTEAGASAYHDARGTGTRWDAISDQSLALLRGSEYVDYNFRRRFPGWKVGQRQQIREWPRSWAFDVEDNAICVDVVPVEVEYATYEAALREGESNGSLMPDYTPGSQVTREKVGPIEVQYNNPTGVQSVTPIIQIVGAILAPVLTGGPSSRLAGVSERI